MNSLGKGCDRLKAQLTCIGSSSKLQPLCILFDYVNGFTQIRSNLTSAFHSIH